jgi:hypothetical protein
MLTTDPKLSANESEQVLRLDDPRLGVHDRHVLRQIYQRLNGYALAKPTPYLTRTLFRTDADLDDPNMEPPNDDAA